MNTQTFYIPISRNKLAHFFGRGVIVPSKYLENSQKDIQNRFDDYILFSQSKFTTETDCCIEVVLDAKESERVIPIPTSSSFSIFDRPLAISRVIAIYFRNEEERDNTIYSITKNNGDAFIPERLNNIAKNEIAIDVTELDGIRYNANLEEWSPELKRFDQLMGGFALMRLSNEEENYTPEYFNALGSINNYFSPSNEDARFKILFAREDDEVTDSTFDLYRRLISSELNSGSVVDFSQKESIQVSKNSFGDIDIESIPENTLTYILAILATYGSYGGGKKVDDFVSSFIEGEIRSRDEQELLLTFGINKGYKTLSNYYSFSGVNINLKFKLERKVDYYVIESIYQNTFNLAYEYNPEDIIDPFHELPLEYYDPSAGELLEVKKKRSTGFFALLPIFSRKSKKDTENYTELNTKAREVVSFVIVLIDILVQKINKVQERLDQGAKYVKQSEDRLTQEIKRIDHASTKSEEGLASLKSEIQDSYTPKAELDNLKQSIEQHITALDGRFTQEIKRIDDASTKSEESLANLKSEIQDSYTLKAETDNLKQAIEQNITALDGRFAQEVERIDDASTKSEESLASLKSEIQDSYILKAETDNLKQAINQHITALDGRFTQEIKRIDDASTKSEESLASLKSEIQDSYTPKAEIAELKQALESKYYSKADLDELVRQVVQEVSQPVSDLKSKLEESIELNNKQKETINALNARVNDLEEKFQNLEQKSVQPIRSKASKGQLKNKTSDRVESETGDLFEDDTEPLNEERIKDLTKLKRAELDNIAKNYGLAYNSYRTKSDIANAIAYWEASNDHDNS